MATIRRRGKIRGVKLAFVVHGNPIPKARPRVLMNKAGRTWAFTPATTKAWEQAVATEARNAMAAAGMFFPFIGRLKLNLYFAREGKHHCDLDNLVKAAKDAMNGVLWVDDEQVDREAARRWYGCKKSKGFLIIEVEEL